jgi:allophanate hydrolase
MNARHPPVSADNAWIQHFDLPLLGQTSGSLSGLRFAVKDNIDVAGVPTTAACPEFAFTPSAHATVVAKLLSAGAALCGKTNLDQFACGLNGTRSPFGPVPNAVNPAYVSGGSSSGSAFVVASGQVDFSLGTDTAGSGRVPAGLNHIVGLKPTKGLISTHGVLPAARSADAVSIFSRDVQTAWRVLLSAMGPDAQDPYSRDLALHATPLPKHFRFGIPDHLEWFGDHQAKAEFEKAIAHCIRLGGTPVFINYQPLADTAALLYGSALLAERLEVLESFFKAHPQAVIEPVKTLLTPGMTVSGTDVFRAQTQLRALAQQATVMWKSIDVLLVPTAPTIYRIDDMLEDPIELNRRLGYYTNFVNLLDYAAISIPSSMRADQLPFGITFIGPAASDWQLASLALRFEQSNRANPADLPEGPLALALPKRPESADAAMVNVAVVGAHLSGMPLNGQLTERGAQLIQTTTTAPTYRLYALANTQPPKPGLIRVEDSGRPIEIEVWQMPVTEYGSFVAMIPRPLGIGQIETRDGEFVQGFLCEPSGLQGARDISEFGGWRGYMASLKTPTPKA